MINLHDYLMYFLINVLIIVVVFSIIALFHQQSYVWQNIKNDLSKKEIGEIKLLINNWTSKMNFIRMYNKFRLQKFNHAPLIEFFWTITPTIMLIFMGWPSFKVLYAIEQLIDPIHTITVIGNQWYWTYSYSDFDIVSDFVRQIDSDHFLNNYINEIIKKNTGYDKKIKSLLRPSLIFDAEQFSRFLSSFKITVDSDVYDTKHEDVRIDKKNRQLLKGLSCSSSIFFKPYSSDTFKPCALDFNKIVHKWNLDFIGQKEMYASNKKSKISNFIMKSALYNFRSKNEEMCFERLINKKNLIQSMSKYLRKFEEGKLIYDCVILSDENLPIGYPRLLSTDQVLILPAYVSIRILVTSVDVIHSWALPSHGIKMDAIPGRINQVSFLTQSVGTYWGQCSELCGINHGFMPIEVRILLLNDYLSYISLNISYRQDKLILVAERFVDLYIVRQLEKMEKRIFLEIAEIFLD